MTARSLLPAVLILAIAVAGTVRHRRTIHEVRSQRDSLSANFRRQMQIRSAVVHAGESIPDGMLVDAAGTPISLRDLAARGLRNFYFYRDDCLACQRMSAELDSMPRPVRERTAFIQFAFRQQMPAPGEPRHYAWQVDTTERRIVASVPAFFAVDGQGRIVAAADFETRHVADLMALHGLLRSEVLDTLLRRVPPRVDGDSSAARP